MISLHADDYGIDAVQAGELASLCAKGGSGGLSSMSIFANSPSFGECAAIVRPLVDAGEVDLSLHLNLVEGPACAAAGQLPLLVDGRGMMRRDFLGLLALSCSPSAARLRSQVRTEAGEQIGRFLREFPWMRGSFRVDSHQHVHMVPAVFDGLMDALSDHGCTLRQLRIPVESTKPYVESGHGTDIPAANRAKRILLNRLASRCDGRLPDGCSVPAFCGVLMSGCMQRVDEPLLEALERDAGGRDVEVLFHPVTVPVERCLDPQNARFANACASPSRDEEAEAVRRLAL